MWKKAVGAHVYILSYCMGKHR